MGQRLVLTINNNKERICNVYFHWSAYTYNALSITQKICNRLSANGVIDWKLDHIDKVHKIYLVSLIKNRFRYKNHHPSVNLADIDEVMSIDDFNNEKDKALESDLIPDDVKVQIKSLECTKESDIPQNLTKMFDYIYKAFDNNSMVLNKLFGEYAVDRNDGIINLKEESMAKAQSYSEGDVIIDIHDGTVIFDVFHLEEIEKVSEDESGKIEYIVPAVDDEEIFTHQGNIDEVYSSFKVKEVNKFVNFIEEHEDKLVLDDNDLYQLRYIS